MDPGGDGLTTLMTGPPRPEALRTTGCNEGLDMGTATILVVDDERKIRGTVRSYLEREGYAVLVADTGQRALETLERARPDLLVLDLMLPDLSGEEIARAVRSHSSMPIIMLTAKASEDDRVSGLRLGAGGGSGGRLSPIQRVREPVHLVRRWGHDDRRGGPRGPAAGRADRAHAK